MNKILILYEPLASWCLSVCKHENLWCVCCAALYPSTALSVALCPGSARIRQLCWKNSSYWPWVYCSNFFFQKKDPTSIHKCQFFMSDLGKKKWLPAMGSLLFVFSCVSTNINCQQMVGILLLAGKAPLELVKVCPILCWSTVPQAPR